MKKLIKEKNEAIKMRISGMSYSQIQQKIKVSKSTLSFWLEKYPLSADRIRELMGSNLKRIEKCRNTKLQKRQKKLDEIYQNSKKELTPISKREIFIAGLFLYWGEGTKAARDVTAFTNTDPAMIKFFIKWIVALGVSKNKLKIKLHLYSDMDIQEQVNFWSNYTGILKENFRKPYIKNSTLTSLTYKNSFDHGTCTVSYGNSDLYNRIMMSLKYLREIA